jgi:cation transport regulator ChaB
MKKMPEHIKGESRDDWMARCIPYLIEKENKTKEQAAGQCGGMYDSWKKANMSEADFFEPPESGDAPKGVKNILNATYNNCRQAWVDEHPKDRENQANKESCARIAWNAVKEAGWKNANGKWTKSGKMSESEPETYDLPNIEIFAAGTWKDSVGKLHKFDKSSLQNIIEAFNELKGKVDPPLKLGHSIKQELLASGGLPAAGWLDNLRISGNKILADFKKIPSKIYKIIKNGGLKRVSPEIVYDYQAQPGGKKYPLFLEAAALLGVEQKAMKTLNDFVNVYSEEIVDDVSFELDYNIAVFTEGDIHDGMSNKTEQEVIDMELEKMLEKKEKEVDELKGKFSESETKVKTLETSLNETNGKVETLEAENKDLKGKVSQFAEEAKKKEISDYVDSKIKEGKIPAALKDEYVAQFSDLPEDKLEGMKKIIDKTPKIDFSEHSVATSKGNDTSDNKTNELGDAVEGVERDKEIKAYMSEHNVDYLTADERIREQREEA